MIADHGGKLALTALGEKQVVSSGTEDTAAAQQPAIQAAIQAHAAGIVIAGNDPQAVCPALKQAQAQGTKVVAFDSDVNCRQLFINQADTETIGRSQVALLAKLMHYKGQFAILSAASTATNQNAWIKYMKLELKKPVYKNMKLVKIYYGNDNPAQSRQATVAMLQAYPNLKGIESPTTVGISSAAQYLSTSKYKKKVALTGLGLPSQMKKYVHDGTVTAFALWNPEDLGLPRRLRGHRPRGRQDHGQGRPDVHGRQARQVQDRQGPGRPAAGDPRPSVHLHGQERRQVQVLGDRRKGVSIP